MCLAKGEIVGEKTVEYAMLRNLPFIWLIIHMLHAKMLRKMLRKIRRKWGAAKLRRKQPEAVR